MVPRYKKIKTEEGRSRQRQEIRGFMPIEAVVEAEAENGGRKREQSSSKKDADSFHHIYYPKAREYSMLSFVRYHGSWY